MPNLYQTLMFHARRRPDAIAVSDRERQLTYADLAARTRQLADWLESSGIRRGDRVALVLWNSIDYVALIHATALIGFVLVPVNTRYSAKELAFLLGDCEPSLIIYDEQFEALMQQTRDGNDLPAATRWLPSKSLPACENRAAIAKATHPDQMFGRVEDDDVAMIVYTSGTTSRPKGAMLTHANFVWNAINHLIELGIDENARTALATPLFHIAGLGVINGPVLYAGGEMHIVSQFNPDDVLETLTSFRPTHLFLLATMWVALTDHPDFKSFKAESVSYVQAAGATLSSWRQELIREAFPNAQFGLGFGMTETCVTTIKNRYTSELLDHPGSLGYAWRHVAYRLVDEDGAVLEDQRGPGELQIKCPTVFKGYWRQPELTAEVLDSGGWLSTGDLVRFDDNGFLYFIGRSKDMIKTGGENVAAVEVEECLSEHPGVKQAAVFSLPHEYWGEELVAAVMAIPDTQLEPDELRLWCRERISGFKVPKRVFIVDELPVSSSGKVQKFRLREAFASDSSPVAGTVALQEER